MVQKRSIRACSSGVAFPANPPRRRSTIDSWNRRAQVEPNNPEAWHTIAVYYQEKSFRDKTLPSKVALDYVMKALAAEEKALALNAEYHDAVLYKNILLRQQALYEKNPARIKQLLDEAEVLYKKAEQLRKKQAGTAAAADPSKKAGS